MGHVSRRGFARRACCCCLILLLLVAAAPGADVARGYARAAEYLSVSPARGNIVSNGQEARSLVYATLGGSLTNPKRPEKFWLTECIGRISYHPYMALP